MFSGMVTASVLCFFAGQVQAAAEIAPVARELAKATLDQRTLATPLGRANLIKAVSAYCRGVQSVYPHNSPSEDQWLEGEISGGGNRVEKVLSSPELGRRIAKNITERCISTSGWAEKRPDQSYYFIALVHTFLLFSRDAAFYANKNGIDAGTFALEFMPRNSAEALAYAAMMIKQQEISK